MGRIRSNSNALSLISKSNYLIKEIKPNFFNNKKQLHLEIGMGKGDFIIQSAIQYPNINFIGIERDNTIVLKAINKLNKLERKIDNLLIININANDLQK
jgi:tRNA (guanine-N7-)-methyltransferase